MTPEEQHTYFMLREAYETGIGKEPWEMTVEEKLTFAAMLLSNNPESTYAIKQGKRFRLSPAQARETAEVLRQTPEGTSLSQAYRPAPNTNMLLEWQRRRITALVPTERNLQAFDDYTRNTSQQDLQMAVVFFEPGPMAGFNYIADALTLTNYMMTFLADSSDLPAKVGSRLGMQDSLAASPFYDGDLYLKRALGGITDPERLPLVTPVVSYFAGGDANVRVADPIAETINTWLPEWGGMLYTKGGGPVDQNYRESDLALGVDPAAAGKKNPTGYYANPMLSFLLSTWGPAADANRELKKWEDRGIYSRQPDLANWRTFLMVTGAAASVGETSTDSAVRSATYEVPYDSMPRR
jgi:hypothetical protein